MAKMYGMSGGRRFTCGCCDWWRGKRSVKAQEERRAFREAHEEMTDFPHDLSVLCYDPKTGMVGCDYCYGDDYDHYDNADLDGIEGVWCNVDWRGDPYIQQLMKDGFFDDDSHRA